MGHPTIDDFCAQVCQQVRFRPDHAAIRAELAAHWEDHAAALMERGIPEEEAARRALEAMGDPEEIGKELDKSHSPLLGWFQELFRALVWTALAVLLMCAIPWVAETVHNIADPPVYDARDTVPLLEQYDKLKLVADYAPEDAVCRWRAYTFSVERVLVTWQHYPYADGYTLQANCLLRAVHPNPWLRWPRIDGWIQGEDDLGNVYASQWQQAGPDGYLGLPYTVFGGATRITPFVTYYDLQIICIDPEATQLTLRFNRYGETLLSFTLPLQGGEANE